MTLSVIFYTYHFVRTILSIPFCPIPFCPYAILSIPFCPYHFVRYHFVLEPFSPRPYFTTCREYKNRFKIRNFLSFQIFAIVIYHFIRIYATFQMIKWCIIVNGFLNHDIKIKNGCRWHKKIITGDHNTCTGPNCNDWTFQQLSDSHYIWVFSC